VAVFGRRKGRSRQAPVDDVEPGEAAGEEEEAAVGEEEAGSSADPPRAVAPRPRGPWDSADLPADDVRDRVDLGALRVSVGEDVELRVDLDPSGGVVAATLVHGAEVMQLGVFAAPRTEPIWAEVRTEIADSLREGGSGGSATEAQGEWGVELHARIPTDQPGVFAAARLVGIDGPRWFLRALVSGPLAAAGEEDPVLTAALREVVVVRGGDAMPPRDALPLRLPKEAQVSAEEAIAQQEQQAQQAQQAQQTLPPLADRGPETTETA